MGNLKNFLFAWGRLSSLGSSEGPGGGKKGNLSCTPFQTLKLDYQYIKSILTQKLPPSNAISLTTSKK
jgi:hypothetical protein